MPPPSNTPKTMSSRLLTMKFMQRSAAASPVSTPGSDPLQTPTNNSNEPPAKKQRLSTGDSSGAGTPTRTPEQLTVDRVMAEDERKRGVALERQGREAGETKWVLNFREAEGETENGLRVVSTGFGGIDAEGAGAGNGSNDEEDGSGGFAGRKSFGNFQSGGAAGGAKRKLPENGEDEGSSEDEGSESGEEGEEEDDPTGAAALVNEAKKEAGARAKAERKAKKAAEKADAQRIAGDRRRKSVNMNKAPDRGPLAQSGGISSGRGGGGGGAGTKAKDCYLCGKVGHIAKECPKQKDNKKR